MKKIILDENLPFPLKKRLSQYAVVTVQEQGWSGIKNEELLHRIDGVFDLLLTGDKNLCYQQQLKGRRITIVELPFLRLDQLSPLIEKIEHAIDTAKSGDYVVIAE